MAEPKTVSLRDLAEARRNAYEHIRADGRPMSGTVERSVPESAQSTTRLVAQPSREPSDAPLLRHAEPCTYHVSEPEHADVIAPRTRASRMSRAEAANARALQAEQHRRDAEHHMLRKDYHSALAAMDLALRYEASARNEAFYAWLLHLSTSAVGGRVHPRAWQHIESALRRDPGSADVHFHHAMLLKHAGRQDDAHDVFRRVVRIDAKHPGALREIRLWEMRTRPNSKPGLIERMLGRRQ